MHYIDLQNLEEDSRINVIGRTVMESKKSVEFVVDDLAGKANRYCRKIKKRFPRIEILDQKVGPVAGVITIKVGLKK